MTSVWNHFLRIFTIMLYFVLYLEVVLCFNFLFSQEFFEALLLVLTGYPV